MQLTRFTEYSLRVLVHLAEHPGERVTIRRISDDYGISRNHLMKVVSFLSAQGYVESQRGPGGGVRLRRPPEEITLEEVVRDTESELTLLECMRAGEARNADADRRLSQAMGEALDAFFAHLRRRTIADVTHVGGRFGQKLSA